MKISAVSVLVIGALAVLYTLAFNASERKPTLNSQPTNFVPIDTTKNIEKVTFSDTEPKIDTINKTKSTNRMLLDSTPVSEEKLIAKINYNPFQKEHQILRITTKNDTILTCNEGTILKISKGSFVNPKTGKTTTGTTDLKVTEYYKLSDMLLANLSTVSNGQLLETGGMLFLEAKQGTTDLKLKDDRAIEISFPKTNKREDMQLFLGAWDDKTINWNLQNVDDLKKSKVLEPNIQVPFNIVEEVPLFPGCENEITSTARKKCTSDKISTFIIKNFNTDVAYNLGLVGRQRILSVFRIDNKGDIGYIQSRSPHPRLSAEADRVIALLPKMIPGKQRGKTVTVPYSLPISFATENAAKQTAPYGSTATMVTYKPPTEIDTTYELKRGIAEDIRAIMHDNDLDVDSIFIANWKRYKTKKLIRNYKLTSKNRSSKDAVMLRKPLFEMNNSPFKILKQDSVTRGGHVIRVPWDSIKIPTTTRVMKIAPKQLFYAGNETLTIDEFESRLEDPNDQLISSQDLGYYVLKSSNLGWINCDRFINGRTKRIDYKLNIPNAENAIVSMVFKSYNSILPSWHTNTSYDFRAVGANENIILVAIKRKEGKLFYDAIETITEANPKMNFDFEEVSLDVLKTELEKLNSTFD
ncbi:MAG: hypothetical protein WA775_03175 [Psychroserpens sp.]|uniref:hypothetical protein n=1 Tax=Psychroserpens sp. TaxID=2020870 RepID=UPI003CC453BD